ncbi:uncharacterized protein TNCV_3275171 [Trichonephila clavipes]|nr:uncharacterized protein TNCV_3275171 [Trichonephila clavipes]
MIYHPFGNFSELSPTVTCMVLKAKANDRRTSRPCHHEFCEPRSDYVRQVALETTQQKHNFEAGLNQDECVQRLQLAFGDESPCYATVFRWFYEFYRGCAILFRMKDIQEGRGRQQSRIMCLLYKRF